MAEVVPVIDERMPVAALTRRVGMGVQDPGGLQDRHDHDRQAGEHHTHVHHPR